MLRVYIGAVMVIAGIAGFIEAHSHHPVPASGPISTNPITVEQLAEQGVANGGASSAEGLSQTAYDLIRIGAWALVILGAVTVVIGIVRAARTD
ncbi:MAG: hypothetical protein JWM60_858 [Solirubrobacterales bacterium]|nr:hypothetical protein [Solirubrobacterales bacterium]